MKSFISSISYVLYRGFAFYLPETYSKISLFSKPIRAFLARGFAKHIGKNVTIERKVIFGKEFSMGDNSGIAHDTRIQGKVTFGDNVMFGPNSLVYTRNHRHDRTDIPVRFQGYDEEKPVVLGNDIWTGANIIILPGRKIGNGVIIGAGSVITKDIPDYAIVGGNPARIIKFRNEKKEDNGD